MNQPYQEPSKQVIYTYVTTEYLRSHSVCVRCNSCGKEGATVIKPSLNIGNCCLCYCVGLAWSIIQKVGRKDYNCHDAEHNCANCGKFIGKYEAC